MLMGYREYARHRGVSLGAVQKAVRAGRITANDEKKIDSAVADRDWDVNTDASRVAVSAVEATAPLAQKEISFATPSGEGGDKSSTEELTGSDNNASRYRESRASREFYVAAKQKVEYEQLLGQLINVDEAKRIAFTSFRAIRDSVLNVAARVKDQLAAETDPHVCEELLERELSAALASVDVVKLNAEADD
ncbi:hypothetical protein [Duganella phyllosphaerae]|uniref:Terminase small subunit n=1 Tax=Duganella phyllosphaerae TaxID=762836 RepID=A0A1E7WZ77_9BURK|nr:hypothetical protein [Duganella phyllosphaerae]OFA05180.1 hypothetical protein DUPY_15830 [Duganella phyllosphaerae]